MNEINSSTFTKNAKINLELLGKIDYTGRGLIIGKSPDDKNLIHVYWISGRSENSKNRIFVKDSNNFVRTEAFDETKVEDPSLIIYYPLMHIDNLHCLSNGDQTTTIYNFLKNNKPYEQAILSRTF